MFKFCFLILFHLVQGDLQGKFCFFLFNDPSGIWGQLT